MWKKLALCTVPVQVAALALLYAGIGSAQVPDPPDLGIVDLPSLNPPPESLTLSGTIRDFKASHPDFEDTLGDDRGITTSTIGPDRKPVYASATTTPTTSGKANFDQWYRDVPDVNLSTEYAITLDRIPNSEPPVYRYANDAFFPIDDQLWGDEGELHNYWFTYELHSSFTYQGGETFNFTGDDDVWVYINDQQVIDLGGVHGAEPASVSLDDVAGQIGLVPGQTYSFDMFFAERHTSQSNFVAETSITLTPPTEEPPTAPTPTPTSTPVPTPTPTPVPPPTEVPPPSDEKPPPPPKKP